jgi:uncharacterized protein YecT (DUF1311 family)
MRCRMIPGTLSRQLLAVRIHLQEGERTNTLRRGDDMKRLQLERRNLSLVIAGVMVAALVKATAVAAQGPGPKGPGAGVAGDCGKLANQGERATCFAVQLREADRANERLWKKLLSTKSESEAALLRKTQAEWAAGRNRTCGLEDEGKDHERWLQAVLGDPVKTMCALNETNKRVLNLSAIDELQVWMQNLGKKPYTVAPSSAATPAPTASHQEFAASGTDCAQAAGDQERSACFGSLLRDADLTLNRLYKFVARSVDRSGKKRLIEEQRSWLAARARTCSLDETETDRERWVQGVLADTRKTACVLQMTRERIVDLARDLPDR